MDSIGFFLFPYFDIFWKNVVNIKIIRLVTKDRAPLLITVIFCLLWVLLRMTVCFKLMSYEIRKKAIPISFADLYRMIFIVCYRFYHLSYFFLFFSIFILFVAIRCFSLHVN